MLHQNPPLHKQVVTLEDHGFFQHVIVLSNQPGDIENSKFTKAVLDAWYPGNEPDDPETSGLDPSEHTIRSYDQGEFLVEIIQVDPINEAEYDVLTRWLPVITVKLNQNEVA
jgi:hypothetical protein